MSTALRLALIAAFWIAVGLVQKFNWDHGVAKAVVLLILLLSIPALIVMARRARSASGALRWLPYVVGILLVAQIAYLGKEMRAPHLVDIATTTLAAGDAILHGENPYRLPIDTVAQGVGFPGYKYLPVMALTYLPLGETLGARGVLLTNLLLLLATLWLMWRLAGGEAGMLAAFLLLMLPLAAEQLFAKGSTDLAAVVPLLVGLAFVERNGFVTGLCIGLSIAAKPVPGGLFIPALLPAAGQRRDYTVGIVVGLLPILPFAWNSPSALYNNIVVFTATRRPDSTSWLASAGPDATLLAHTLLVALFLAAAIHVWRRAPALAARCGIGALLTIAAILSGPAAHHNYQLWWLPFYCLLLALALAPGDACQAASLRYITNAKIDAGGS